MNASNHDHDDARGAAASEEAAVPSEVATQVASDGAPAPAPAPAPDAETETELNHQHPVEIDLEELVARAEKADEYLELAKRTKADFENFRKRTARDAAAAQTRGVSKLARELLPAIDNLDRALVAASTTAAEELASGIKLVHDEILAAFARAGIEPFSPEGEAFDPQEHEAVAQLPAEEVEPGTVIEVYQRGYRLGDAVLRPARVSVAG
ncbi:MAG TPA: nucleotide exchange factor GrpE [Solirubrobacteraceae bacterium]|nr:nucleotide exchange factor GrpE [Solirubrobacteraceae bacterium]